MLEDGVSLIIPTSCENSRKKGLLHAIDSILNQERVVDEIIVVANGSGVDEELFESLVARPELTVIRKTEGSQRLAQQAGRDNIRYRFFCFLDDDDELLPYSIEKRYNMLADNPQMAAVIINGWVRSSAGDFRYFDYSEVSRNPLLVLLKKNWMASCGGMFRAELVDANYFNQPYFEWTYVAFHLALKYPIGFIDADGFNVHADTPGSLSKSADYMDYYIPFLKQLLDNDLPSEVVWQLKYKLAMAYHCQAAVSLQDGQLKKAWRYHVTSLLGKRGWQFVPYTLKVLWGMFFRY